MENCHSRCTSSKMSLRIKSQDRSLRINIDQVADKDWGPTLKVLKNNSNLHTIKIKSDDHNFQGRGVMVKPASCKQRVIDELVNSLIICMKRSDVLTQVELQSVPLTTEHISKLSHGIQECTSLQNLLLTHFSLLDEGIEILYDSICSHTGLSYLDFTGCELSTLAANTIAKLIKMQRLARYDETWKQSLRYRVPNPKLFPGIRRVTLNDNPGIGDEGFLTIIHELMDDLWVKALDAQNCGLTDRSANKSMQLLKVNDVISILDLRRNANVRDILVVKITQFISDRRRNKKKEPSVGQPSQTRSVISGSKQTYNWLEVQSNQSKTIPEHLKLVGSIELPKEPSHTSIHSQLTERMQRMQINNLRRSVMQERKKIEKEEQEKNYYKKKLSEKCNKDWQRTKQLEKKIYRLENELHAYVSESQIPKKKSQTKSLNPFHIVKPKSTSSSTQAKIKSKTTTYKPKTSEPKILVSNPQGPINSFQTAAAVYGHHLYSSKKSKYATRPSSKRAKTNKSTKPSKQALIPQKNPAREPSFFEFKGCDQDFERFEENFEIEPNDEMKQYFEYEEDFENDEDLENDKDFENEQDSENEEDIDEDDPPKETLKDFVNNNMQQLQQMKQMFSKFSLMLPSQNQKSSQS